MTRAKHSLGEGAYDDSLLLRDRLDALAVVPARAGRLGLGRPDRPMATGSVPK